MIAWLTVLFSTSVGPFIPATVHHCLDGDTCRVELELPHGSLWFNARLFGIDAPETPGPKKKKPEGQPLGKDAHDQLNEKIKGKTVAFRQSDLDFYNRLIIEIYLQEENINLWMVRNGWAEVYAGSTKRISLADYFEAQKLAQKEKKGIWGLKNYQSPKEFRK